MIWVAILGVTFLALLAGWRTYCDKISKERANGTYAKRFIYVREDGTARELIPDEVVHLNTDYKGADGARPYIKSTYGQLTPDGKIWGYLSRRKLPRQIPIDLK